MGLRRALGIVVAATIATRFAAALLAPLVRDEAYYLEWSQALDFGYFDHPPVVAWLGITSWLAPSSAFFGRLGGLVVTSLLAPVYLSFFRRVGLTEPRALIAAFALVSFNWFGILSGVLLTPDTPFVAAWTLMLHEAAAALDTSPRRWLTAGLATGFGLLSKYIMVLAFPVLLVGVLFGRPAALRTRWPWLGLGASLLVFSSHLVWNSQNDWTPIRFQMERSSLGAQTHPLASRLPAALPPASAQQAATEPAVHAHGLKPLNAVKHAGSVLGVWGCLLVVALGAVLASLRAAQRTPSNLAAHLRPLLLGATFVPIVFFGAFSLKMHIEPNWPAVYMVGASALLAGYAARHLRATLVTAGANALVVLLLALHARHPFYASPNDHFLSDTAGFTELADVVSALDGPVFFDRHQTGGMLGFLLPARTFAQWPGFSRPSEFLRRAEWNPWTVEALAERGSFWIVTERRGLRDIPGFEVAEAFRVGLCAESGKLIWRRREGPSEVLCSTRPVRAWLIVRYEVAQEDAQEETDARRATPEESQSSEGSQ